MGSLDTRPATAQKRQLTAQKAGSSSFSIERPLLGPGHHELNDRLWAQSCRKHADPWRAVTCEKIEQGLD